MSVQSQELMACRSARSLTGRAWRCGVFDEVKLAWNYSCLLLIAGGLVRYGAGEDGLG